MVLKKGDPNPVEPQSDEEKIAKADEKGKDADKSDKDKTDKDKSKESDKAKEGDKGKEGEKKTSHPRW